MRKTFVVVLLTFILMLMNAVLPALAQTNTPTATLPVCPSTWTYTWTFGTSGGGDGFATWTSSAAPDRGYATTNGIYPINDGGNYAFSINKTVSIPSGSVVTNASANSNVGTGGYGGVMVEINATNVASCGGWYGNLNCVNAQASASGLSYTGSLAMIIRVGSNVLSSNTRLYGVTLSGTGLNPFVTGTCGTATPVTTNTPTPTATNTPGGGVPSGTYYRPLVSADIGEYGIWGNYPAGENMLNPLRALNPDEHLWTAFSANGDSLVRAVASGTVIEITPVIGSSYCGGLRTVLQECILRFDPSAVSGVSVSYSDEFYNIVLSGVSSVKVKNEDDSYFEYIVSNASTHIRVGMQIEPGCIIGTVVTLSLTDPTTLASSIADLAGEFDLNIFNGVETRYATFVSLVDDDERQPIALTLPAEINNACNIDPDTASCLTYDPNLRGVENWETFGAVQWIPAGGIRLQPGAYISVILSLVDGETYAMRVTARRLDDQTAQFSMQLGETIQANNYTTFALDSYTIAPGAISLDAAPLGATVRVRNTGTVAFELTEICVTDGGSPTRPNTCLFDNYSFDENLNSWSFAGGVYIGLTGGSIIMDDDSSIGQSVTLYPNGASSYSYNVYVIAYVPPGYYSDTTTDVQFEWEFGTESGTFITPASPASPAAFGAYPGGELAFNAIVSVDAITTSNFTVTLNIDGVTSTAVHVREVCVDDEFAHWNGGGGQPLPFPVNCNRVQPPAVGDAVGLWVYYLWSSMDRFFQCQLMVTLNQIFDVTYDTFAMLRWSILYAQASAKDATNWVTYDLFPYLNGQFYNIATGRTVVITGATTQQCSDLFCLFNNLFTNVIDGIVGPLIEVLQTVVDAITVVLPDVIRSSLSIFQQIVDLFIRLISEVFNLAVLIVLTLLSILLSLFNFVIAILGSLFNLFAGMAEALTTVEPQYVEGITDCALDYQQNGFCIFLWMLENTYFNDPLGMLPLIIIMGYLSWNVLEWIIELYTTKIREMVDSA